MVGQLGYHELAASGISNSIFFLIAVFPMGVSIAFATIVSILVGKNKKHRILGLIRDAFNVTLILIIICSLFLLLAIYQFDWFRQTAQVNDLSVEYLGLLTISLTPMLLFFWVKNIADGIQYTMAGMITTLITLAVNVLFNYLLIFGKFGFPALGLNGAGYATIISRTIGFIIVLILLLRYKKSPFTLQEVIAKFKSKVRFRFYKQILNLGIPSGLQYFFEVAAFAFAAIMAGWLGAKELAAHQLAITIAAVTYMFVSGISSGTSICVAESYGTASYQKIRRFSFASLSLSMFLMVVFAIGFLLFNKELAALFSKDAEVVAIGAELLIIAAIFQLGDGIQAVSVGLLRGIEDVRVPSLFTLIAYWVIAIPVGYYLGVKGDLSINGIWIGLSLGLSVSAVLLCIRFYRLLNTRIS